jgi:hypothetical protein
VTTTQPLRRYVPFVSTLLMCSGLLLLPHGATAQPVCAIGDAIACAEVSVPNTPQSWSKTPDEPDRNSTGNGAGGAQPFIDSSNDPSSDAVPLDQIADVDANLWTALRFSALWLRGPPFRGADDSGSQHWGTGPVDSSFDATDDDDDGDDDPDTDDGDGVATLVTAAASVSYSLHTSSLLSRVEVHHPGSFSSDVQSLRAPPQ